MKRRGRRQIWVDTGRSSTPFAQIPFFDERVEELDNIEL